MHQKEDMGEVLHVVDFDQLKIENQQYLDRIEERNTELLYGVLEWCSQGLLNLVGTGSW